jgi:hypothetical protein
MKLTAILAAISLSSIVVAAPVPTESRRGMIPKPMDLIEMMYPHSGIPRLAGKLEKELHICTYPMERKSLNGIANQRFNRIPQGDDERSKEQGMSRSKCGLTVYRLFFGQPKGQKKNI